MPWGLALTWIHYCLQQHTFLCWQMGAEVDPYPSCHHPTQHFNASTKIDLTFSRQAAVSLRPFSSLFLYAVLIFCWQKKGKKRQFSTPIKATITGLGYLSVSFICSAARAVQPALKVNIFAWHSVRSNRKQRLRYIYTSKFVKMLHLRTLVRQSRSERFSLSGCQRQPCEQQAGSLKTDSLAAEDFTMPGFLNSSHPLWFPTFRIPIYPAALKKEKKKKKREAEVSSEIDDFYEVEGWPFFTVTPDTLF